MGKMEEECKSKDNWGFTVKGVYPLTHSEYRLKCQ